MRTNHWAGGADKNKKKGKSRFAKGRGRALMMTAAAIAAVATMASCEQATSPDGSGSSDGGHQQSPSPSLHCGCAQSLRPRPPIHGDLIDVEFPLTVSRAAARQTVICRRADMFFQKQQMVHRFTEWDPSTQEGRDFRDFVLNIQGLMLYAYDNRTNGWYTADLLLDSRSNMINAIINKLAGDEMTLMVITSIAFRQAKGITITPHTGTVLRSSFVIPLYGDLLRMIDYGSPYRIPFPESLHEIIDGSRSFLNNADRQALQETMAQLAESLVRQSKIAMNTANIEIDEQLIRDIWTQIRNIDCFSVLMSRARQADANSVTNLPPIPRAQNLSITMPEPPQEEASGIDEREAAGMRM